MGYDAFISYSHAADGKLAPAIQKGLQALARPWHRRRALHIFRDTTGLSVNPSLWTGIEEALGDSEWFILFASPEAARSDWVNREVAHFVATKGAASVLPILTEGEWVWDAAAGDFDWARSSAVPEALRGVFTDEPRHLDLRWARDEAQLDLRHHRFREAVAEIAAPIHHRSKDELESEDLRQHRRMRRLVQATVALLTALVLLAAGLGFSAQRSADRARDAEAEATRERDVAQSRQLAAQSLLLHDDRPVTSMLLARLAYQANPTAEAERALLGSLLASPRLARSGLVPDGGLVALVSVDEAIVGLQPDGSLVRWDDELADAEVVDLGLDIGSGLHPIDDRHVLVGGQRAAAKGASWWVLDVTDDDLGELDPDDALGRFGPTAPVPDSLAGVLSPDGPAVVTLDGADARGYRLRVAPIDGSDPVLGPPQTGWATAVATSPVSTSAFVFLPGYDPTMWDLMEMEKTGDVTLPPGTSIFAAAGAPLEGPAVRFVAAVGEDVGDSPLIRDGVVALIDASTGELVASRDEPEPMRALAWSPDGAALAVGGATGTLELLGVNGGYLNAFDRTEALPGHHGEIVGLAFSPDGDRLYSATAHELFVWDLTNPTRITRLLGDEGGTVVAVRPDGEQVAAMEGADLVLRALPSGEEQGRVEIEPDDRLAVLARYLDDDTIVVVKGRALDRRGPVTATVVTVGSDGPKAGEPIELDDGEGAQLAAVALDAAGKKVYVGGNAEVSVWDLDRGEKVDTMTLDIVGANEVTALGVGDDGTVVAATYGSVVVFDAEGRQRIAQRLPDPELIIGAVWVGPGAEWVALGGSRQAITGELVVWDVRGDTVEDRWTPVPIDGPVAGLAFDAPRGRIAAVTAFGTQFVDVATGQIGAPLLPGATGAVAFTPDGSLVAAAAGVPTAAGQLSSLAGPALWLADPASLVELPCEVATKELTDDEWLATVGPDLERRRICDDLAWEE